MSRGGRLAVAVLAAGLVASGTAGCATFGARSVQVAPSANAADCVVGRWKQSEGWQRVVTEAVVSELMMISGGRQLELKADGTGHYTYLDPTLWKSSEFGEEIEVVYAGEATLKYTAADGKWTDTGDASRSTTQVTLRGRKDPVTPGPANRSTQATYVCDETNLILTGGNFRQAFKRV
jgi:hypothetical protein